MHIFRPCPHVPANAHLHNEIQEISPWAGLAGPPNRGTVEQVRSRRQAPAAASLLQTLAT
jgi:hypothetical protein